MNPMRRRLVAQIEAAVGRHDEPAIYAGDPGDPGLAGGPGSMSWELHADLATLFVAGTAAILMEVAHPSVMAGVFAQSSYRTQPERRARNTLGYILRTTFGTTRAATRVIESVKAIHERIHGTRPDGVPYHAGDPELLAWVHTCIPWAVMTAYDRYTRRLSTEDKDRYLREQAVIGRMGGATWVPESVAELEAYVERMRPALAVTEQTREFMQFISGTGELVVSRGEKLQRWLSLHASMSLMPAWAQRLLGTTQTSAVNRYVLRPSDHLALRLVRFAVPELPCVRIARARVNDARGGPDETLARRGRDDRPGA
ncbi:MAG: oxygenase MpaB family protein [Kofleriaceae bacterium]